MKRTIYFGKIDYFGRGKEQNLVEVHLELRSKGGEATFRRDQSTKQYVPTGEYTEKYLEFSASGAIWHCHKTDWCCGGQCLDTIAEYIQAPLFREIYRLWKMYHLNGMHAGTPEQEQAIEEWQSKGHKYEYTAVCDYLKSINLYEVDYKGKPYKYGHAWLHQDIPENDLQIIKHIIETGELPK